MDFKELKELGFTEGEIKVYTSLLSLGLTTKGPIAKEARVSESKVYEILERLKNKGLVSYILKKKGMREITYYKPANPVLLKDFLDKKREKLEQEEKLLSAIIPDLQAQLKATEKEYSAVIYEGFKGIQTNAKEALKLTTKSDEWISMGGRSSKEEKYNDFWINFFKKRAAIGGKIRFVFVDEPSPYTSELCKIKNSEVRFLRGISPAAVAITKNRVMIFTYEGSPGCLAITNDAIANSFRGFFESLWRMAKK